MKVRLYLLVSFAVSWAFGGLRALVPDKETLSGVVASTALGVAFMFGPLVGAFVAQKAAGTTTFKPLGVRFTVNRWWLLAWLAPLLIAGLTLAITLLIPGTTWSPDLSGFWDRLAETLPQGRIDESRRQLENVPRAAFWLLLLLQSLIAGATVNALAAFGEELGWRGFLFCAWSPLGFWKSSLLVGLVWGIWHAPLILQGHNYPQHPVIGTGMMILWCMLLAPPFNWIRDKTDSVVAASLAHGTLNASAGIPLYFIRGGDDLSVGITGLPGFLALLLVNLALVLAVRPEAACQHGRSVSG